MLPNPLVERERRAGREGFVQRMLASLILDRPPPADGTRAPPTERGEGFLRALHQHAFERSPPSPVAFVNQLRLEAMDQGGNGWADHGVLWADEATVVELKTDPGSIRDGQIDWYLDLALRQYPDGLVSLLYVTRDPVNSMPGGMPARASYANITWDQVADLLDAHWHDEPEAWSRTIAAMMADYLRRQLPSGRTTPPPEHRPYEPVPVHDADAEALLHDGRDPAALHRSQDLVLGLEVALEVAADGRQRGVPLHFASPDDAKAYSRELKAFLARQVERDPSLTRVLCVVWYRFTSGGRALTEQGDQTDVEVRLSRYRRRSSGQPVPAGTSSRTDSHEPEACITSSPDESHGSVQPEQAVTRLRGLLRRWADGFARSSGKVSADAAFDFGVRDLDPDEAAGFLRAYDQGLVVVDDDARFALPGATCPPNPRLVGKKPGSDAVALHTEYLIQIGAYAELVLEHGWHPASLSLEMGEYDLVAVDGAGKPVILVEAKARLTGANSLEHLWQAFQSWSAGDNVGADATTRRKWRALLEQLTHGPLTLWLVASGARWAFAVRQVDGRVEFTRREELPRP